MTAALEEGEWSAARPAAIYPRERPGTHFTGGWVNPKVGLDGRKNSSPPGFDSVPSNPWSVVIPTELPGPRFYIYIYIYIYIYKIFASVIIQHFRVSVGTANLPPH